MSKLHKAAGRLPDDKTPEQLRKTTAGDLLDFGQKVADDDVLWASLPTHLIPSDADKERMAATAGSIARMSAAPLDEKVLARMVADAQEGESRDKLREWLRHELEESR